jgi:hypothetical protein
MITYFFHLKCAKAWLCYILEPTLATTGAISTLARQGGRSIWDLHLSFFLWFGIILERVWRLEEEVSSIEEVVALFQVLA